MGLQQFPVPAQGTDTYRRAYLAVMKSQQPAPAWVNTSTSAAADVDTSWAWISFVAPPSGQVFVEMAGLASSQTGSGLYWCLRDLSGNVIGPSEGGAASGLTATVPNAWTRGRVRLLVQGLTAGQTYTWKMAHYVTAGTSATYTGQITMTVEDAAASAIGAVNGGIWYGSQVVQTGDPNSTGLVVVGASGQTVPLQTWKDSTGAVKSAINGDGSIWPNSYMERAMRLLSGGGVLTVDTGYSIRWTERFMVMAAGKGTNTATDGYFDISMPPNGTVIPRVGGGSGPSVTVAAAGINFDPWDALYYILPLSGASTSLPANFRIVNYTAALEIPPTWVPIAIRNSDGVGTFGHADHIQWANGVSLTPRIPATLVAPFANYGATWPVGAYYKTGNRVYLEGLILLNGGGVGGTIFTLPVGFRPGIDTHSVCHSAGASGAVNCYRDGRVAYNYGPTYVSLDVVSFLVGG